MTGMHLYDSIKWHNIFSLKKIISILTRLGAILQTHLILFRDDQLNSFADDSYLIEIGSNEEEVLTNLGKSTKLLITWLRDSGMLVNVAKTEVCIFSNSVVSTKSFDVDGTDIVIQESIGVLGITFDAKLNWQRHISNTISSCYRLLLQ